MKAPIYEVRTTQAGVEPVEGGTGCCSSCCCCSGRPLLDVMLLSLSVGLLLALGILLKGDLPSSPWADTTDPTETPPTPSPGDPGEDPSSPTSTPGQGPESAPRRRLLMLGGALLLVSLSVCMYVMCRLGLCCNGREGGRRRLRSGLPSVNSSLHLIARGRDLPPSYDAVVLVQQQPPPYSYCAVLLEHQDDEAKTTARPQEAG